MAWNDSGKNENPWQRRPDKGPPDLDELLRRLQKRLRGLFGGSGGGGGGDGPSPGGAIFGPPIPTCSVVMKACAR